MIKSNLVKLALKMGQKSKIHYLPRPEFWPKPVELDRTRFLRKRGDFLLTPGLVTTTIIFCWPESQTQTRISIHKKQRTRLVEGPCSAKSQLKKALQWSETKTRELLFGTEEKSVFPKGAIDLPYEQFNDCLTDSKQNRIELVARPGKAKRMLSTRVSMKPPGPPAVAWPTLLKQLLRVSSLWIWTKLSNSPSSPEVKTRGFMVWRRCHRSSLHQIENGKP